jgi:hypothetical protein
MKPLTIAIAAALLTTSGAAAAQSATDAQCLILSNAFAKGVKDAQQQEAAKAAFYFYLGRIGETATAAQLKALLDTQGKTITEKTAGETMNKCVQGLEAKVELLQSLAPAKPAAQQQQKPQTPQGR